jgi:glycine betaine catabolism B
VSLLFPPASSSVLALVTTVHLALASLRNHRRPNAGPVSSLALVSTLLAVAPWLFPSLAGLGAGLAVHAVWFAVCERFAPVPESGDRRSGAPGRRTTDSVAATSDGVSPRPSAPAARPKGFVPATVLAAFDEASDIRTFRFTRPDGFDFKAGQFLTIRVRIDGKDVARCYSISSAPTTRGYLEISVKRQGLVSNTLHATLRPGSQVWLRAPAGIFTYPDTDDRPLLLLAGGIGVTPLLSMLRHAISTEPMRPVALLYSTRTEESLAFRHDLALIANRHPQVRVVLAVSGGANSPHIYPGRIDDSLIRATVPDFAHAVALICGPQAMIDGMRALLTQMGVPGAQVRYEVFEAAVAASGGKHADHADAHDHAAHKMKCTRTGQAVKVSAGQTILEAAEAAGVPIDSVCRSGVCGTCRTKVLEGEVACESALLDDGDREDGFVLACVSHPHSDCVVDA